MRRRPTATLLLVVALLATACGARLTDEQREFALRGIGSETTGTGTGAAGDPAAPGADPDDPDAPTADGEGPEVAAPDGTEANGTVAPENGLQAAADDDTADTGGDADAEGNGQPTDTRSMPPGGNGGATDVGVTEEEIVLANISDISGAVPGLFEPEQLAAHAYVEYFTAAEGTIYGRELSFLPLDSQMSAGANRAASIEACDRAFAAIGSMSAFDAGAAPVIDECGIPDIRTAATEPPMQRVGNAFPVEVVVPDQLPVGEYQWIQEQFPTAAQNAAYLYIAGEVTQAFSEKVIETTSAHLGWEWTYVQEIDIAETDYAGFAREMDNRGVEYVTFQGDPSQAARLASAMRQQGFEPEIFHLEANAYTPTYIERAPEAVEGTYITITSVMVEEALDTNEELQRYAQFLNQVAPGEQPTNLGMKAWSAGMLFTKLAKEIGPELTREKMLEALAEVEGWDGGGMHPPADVGAQQPNSCFTMIQVQDAEFQRVHPADGFDCSGDVARKP